MGKVSVSGVRGWNNVYQSPEPRGAGLPFPKTVQSGQGVRDEVGEVRRGQV